MTTHAGQDMHRHREHLFDSTCFPGSARPSRKVLYLLERMYRNTGVASSPERKTKEEKVDGNATGLQKESKDSPAAKESAWLDVLAAREFCDVTPQAAPEEACQNSCHEACLLDSYDLPFSASDSSCELAGEATWQAVESLQLQGPAQTHRTTSANVLYLLERMYQNTCVATSPKRESKQDQVDMNARAFEDKVQESPAANEEELWVRAHSVSRRQACLLHNRSTGEDLEHRRCVAALSK